MKTEDIHTTHMRTAYNYARRSKGKRLQVGCIIVTTVNDIDRIISEGYNGTFPKHSNICEDEKNNTLPEVRHAELNAICKIAASTESTHGTRMYCTHSPCYPCSVLIAACGIKAVYYNEHYRCTEGIDYLKQCGVEVVHLKIPHSKL